MPLPMIHWSAFLRAVFLGLSDMLECLSGLQNGSGVIVQSTTQLKFTTRLARKLCHQIGYYL